MLKANYNVIGVMSGTSLDGIDIVQVKFEFSDGWSFEIIKAETIPYSEYWRQKLKSLIYLDLQDLQDIDDSYSQYLGRIVYQFIHENAIDNIDFIASHGHTALHTPEDGLTYQIGNKQVFTDTIGQKVICDYRVQDVELGGQGAPLVPIGDELLFNEMDYCLNLGGFSNISFNNGKERLAFDICPVNIVLNHYVSQIGLDYDHNGELAAQGTINIELLKDLNDLPFYRMKHPKSLGLEWVRDKVFPLIDKYKLKLEDILRTFVEHIAHQIATELDDSNKDVLITGGGAYNDFLISRIKDLSKANIIIPDENIIEFKEALIFGFLGVLREKQEINCLASVTGASKDHSSGKIMKP